MIRRSLPLLVVLTSLFYRMSVTGRSAPLLDEQAARNSYRVTVWVVRPIAKKVPSTAELEANPARWLAIRLDQRPGLVTGSTTLLRHLTHENPNLSFDSPVRRLEATVLVDDRWQVPVPPPTVFTLRICGKDRADRLEQLASYKPGSLDQLKRNAAGKVLVELLARIAPRDLGRQRSEIPTESRRGTKLDLYALLRPGASVIVNSTLQFVPVNPHAVRIRARAPEGASRRTPQPMRQIESDVLVVTLGSLDSHRRALK